jgi:hypothetical protein
MEFPGGTQAQYDKACVDLGLDTPNSKWPQGIISHYAGPLDNGGWCCVDEWESREDFQKFFDTRLKKAIEDAGLVAKQPQWYKVHNQYRNESPQPVTMKRAA